MTIDKIPKICSRCLDPFWYSELLNKLGQEWLLGQRVLSISDAGETSKQSESLLHVCWKSGIS